MAKDYNAKDIQILEGLDAVRIRPGMYIGSTGTRGLHHILWEIVDNGMDEVANGYGDTIRVTVHQDGSVSADCTAWARPLLTRFPVGLRLRCIKTAPLIA